MNGPRSVTEVGVVVDALTLGDLEVVGQITESSNVALLCEVTGDAAASAADLTGSPVHVIYKPVRGERPLWDFPDGTLAGREVAAFEVSRAGGWNVVPPTVLREGALGAGSVQLWIGDPFAPTDHGRPVDICSPRQVPKGWMSVVDGEISGGRAVSVVHENRDDVRDVAVLDAVVNNGDRKGSHLVRDQNGALWGFDHGVSFSAEPKLRTVLWGWAGDPLRDLDLARLERVRDQLDDPASALATALHALLTREDRRALSGRVGSLLRSRRHPRPRGGWPPIPWPAL
ncbi:MAG: SCO1664 family protein [Actinomycetota bacterium]|nr:SCO1664 family protein [Actinomycetota bacterium]